MFKAMTDVTSKVGIFLFRSISLIATTLYYTPSVLLRRYRFLIIRTPLASNRTLKALYESKMFELPKLHFSERKRIKRVTNHRNLSSQLAIQIASTANGEYILECLSQNSRIPNEAKVLIALRKSNAYKQKDNGYATAGPR